MGLQADVYLDMIVSTQKHLGRFKLTDLATARHNFIALPKILNSNKPITRTGIGVQFQAKTGTVGTFQNVYIGQAITYRTADTHTTGSVPWRHNHANYLCYRKTMAMNREPELIFDYVRSERHGCFLDIAEGTEQNFWTKPTDSTDDKKPFGVPYWIVYNATLGQTGGNPSGFTSGAANIDSDTYTQWKNWSGNYSALVKTDGIRSLRYLMTKCQYISPTPGTALPSYADGMGRELYAGYDNVIAPLEEILESQNDNLGNDVASKDGQVMVRGLPMQRVSYWDTHASAVIWGIDWAEFKPVFLSGENLREDGPNVIPGVIGAYGTDIDTTMNFVCYNRRTQFVLAKSDPTA